MFRSNFQLLQPLLKSNTAVLSECKSSSPLKFVGSCKSLWPICRNVLGTTPSRNVHESLPRSRKEDRREMLASMPTPDEGTAGEKSIEVDTLVQRSTDIYPDKDTFDRLFNGIPFKDVPICNIKATKNNTILSFSLANGTVKLIRSCGMEGFKNTRKGTNVAAQATAITLGGKVIENGVKTVRVRVQGLGPGRMSAIKGLQMSGLEIISVTDSTPVSWNPPRPRKQRKL